MSKQRHQQPIPRRVPSDSLAASKVKANLQNAVALHHRGQLAEAEQIYRNILKVAPDHFDAIHLLGVVLVQRRQLVEGEQLIAKALKINPNDPSALNNRGNALQDLKRIEDALASFDKAVALKPDYAEAFNNRGNALQDLKRIEDALASFDKAVALKPDYAEAFNNRGNALKELKRLDEALASYDKALALKPDYAEAFYNRGNALQDLKRIEDALASFDKAVALKPDYAEAFNNRGNALKELKRLDEALASFDKALALKPDYAEAFYNRGNALQELKRFEEALASYDKAVALKPDYAEAFYNRGNALQELKRFEEALASYDKALALKPDYAEAFNNRGNALQELKRFEEALASYDKALALKPDYAEAFNNRGIALQELKRFEEALASYDKALALKPDYAEAFNNRGNALKELKRLDEALASYDKALALKPDYAEAFNNRGIALEEMNRVDEALASYDKAIALKPDFAEARFGLCMAELPILYLDEPDIIARRTAYELRLRALCNAENPGIDPTNLAKGVGSHQPFFLAYQGYNDRDLQSLYGSFVCRIMAELYPPAVPPPSPAASEPVRVGIVSGFFRDHSNWKLPIKGWLRQLDRRQFRIFCYHTGVRKDAETKAAVAMCDRFVQGPLPIDRWRAEILADAPHVLIYPEVGMDPVAVALAAQRLAAVQCNSWGHPDTSGLPTLDYYLSSDLMEPPDGQNHYTERLVRLPNLSVYYEPIEPPFAQIARHDLGLRSSATVYWCGQSLFKYLPQFDDVFPRIACAASDCQFAFIQWSARTTEFFRQRLDRAFGAFGLRADEHCVFLPRLDQQEFVAAIGQCDVFLDSIGWSGCNSTLESLPHNLPIVTMAGSLMRGRHSMAILKRMGVTETIAETIDDYVSIAVRLAQDVSWRMSVKANISASKHRIYFDSACISGLERFLDHVVRRNAPTAIPATDEGTGAKQTKTLGQIKMWPKNSGEITPDITVVITSCNRYDLLSRTLESFLDKNTDRGIARILVVEDGESDPTFVCQQFGAEAIRIGKRIGQIAAIDFGYSHVETPYIFHLEDDWEFYRSGFIERSRAILEVDPSTILVSLRAWNKTSGHPLSFQSEDRTFGVLATNFGGIWHGFTFSPGLRRLSDYKRLGNFLKLSLVTPAVHRIPSLGLQYEIEASGFYHRLGYRVVILDESGYVRHIGDDRHVSHPDDKNFG